MIKTTTTKLHGETIEVRELTVSALDQIIAESSSPGPLSTIDRIFNPDMVTESMLAASTGLSAEALHKCTPSDLRQVVDAFKEVNSDFLSGMKSLV